MTWAFIGCSSDDLRAYDRGRLAVCASACEGYRRCNLTDAGCESRCAASYRPRGIRASALLEVARCLAELDCAELDADDAFASCADRAAKAEPRREAVVDYCESASKSFFRCDEWWSVEDCTRSVGLWEDEVLAEAQQCHSEECDTIEDCEHAAFRGEGEE